jgi:tetratricopeptide (TPR) repeat protein
MNARRLLTALCTALLSASLALAAGGGGGGGGGDTGASAKIDPEYEQAVAAIEAKQYNTAIPLLQSYLARANNTDAYAENWIAYSYRKSGQLDQAFLHYDKALKIDPRHRGAHSYLGEAYLMAGNVPKAEEHLKVLDKLCFLPCTEYTQLKKAVAYYKEHGQIDPGGK